MKLTIFRLEQLSAQDRICLQKIWPQQDMALLEQQLVNQHQLYAARFNDRLLAAARVTITAHQGTISQLEVREDTRRRGVGHYLLSDIQQQNPQVRLWRVLEDGSAPAEGIEDFMHSNGFSKESAYWIREG